MAVLGALGDLVLALSADTARFQSDLGKADRIAKKFGKEVGQALGNVAGALVALGGSAGFTALVKGQIDAADEALNLSQQVGVSVEKLSAYNVSAKLADVSTDQLATGLRQLSKNQADFVAGTGEAADAFRALGISQEEVAALNGNTAALFELVAGKLSKFEDGANKTALAMKIFGKSGAELIPLINELEETRHEAEALNAIIDRDTAASADRFNDNLSRVGVVVQAFGLNIARAVLPTLEKFSERMVAAAKDTEGMEKAGRIADTALKLVASGGTIVASVFKVTGAAIGSVAAALHLAAQGEFRLAWNALKEGGLDMEKEISGALESLKETWDLIPKAITDAADNVYEAAPKTAKKLAAPALQSAEMVKKAEKDKRDAIMRVHDDAANAAEADAEIARKAAEDKEKAWKQVFATIDKEQEDAIEQGEELLEQLNQGDRFAERFGDSVADSFEDIVFNIENATDAVRAFGAQLARIVFQEAVGNPLAAAVRGAFRGGLGGGGADAGVGVAEEAAALGVPSLDVGTPFVERDGLALLHRGEAVVPAGENRGGGVSIGSIQIGAGNAVTRAEVEVATRRAVATALKVQREEARR